MHGVIALTRRQVAASVAAVIVLCAVAVLAQGTSPPDVGSLAGVVAELRQLRVAIEGAARSQRQTQTLAIYASAQQSRLRQVEDRLEGIRRESAALTLRSTQMAMDLASLEDDASRASPELKATYELRTRGLKKELERLAPELQHARTRESELARTLKLEEERWTNLIQPLEQLVRK